MHVDMENVCSKDNDGYSGSEYSFTVTGKDWWGMAWPSQVHVVKAEKTICVNM
jgi:hypothetical protein